MIFLGVCQLWGTRWDRYPNKPVLMLQGLVLQRSLASVYPFRDPRLGYAMTHRGPGSGLLPQRTQTHIQTCKGSGLCLLPGRSQIYAGICGGLWLWPTRSVVAPLYLLLWSLLSQLFSDPGFWLSPASENVPGLDQFLFQGWDTIN